MKKTRLLFVCLGNICRSPAAEGIMKTLVAKAGAAESIECDSAGTSAYHEGDPADARMIEHARGRGYVLDSRSRPFSAADFETFDYIFTMDESNYRNVLKLDVKGVFRHKVHPMVKFCRLHEVAGVPDPYYQGDDGFQLVLDILEDACGEFLKTLLENKHG